VERNARRKDVPVVDVFAVESFWKRQFAPEVTEAQIAFDVAAGILLPLACLLLDPIVFRSPKGVLAPYALAAYLAIGLSLIHLAIWLIARRPAPYLAGALAAGAFLSFLIGMVLLPYRVFGLMIVVGVLGFAPFLTSFVYLRNCIRAFALARAPGDHHRV